MEPVIGIDARAAAEEPAGRGRYVRELLRGLAGLEGGRYVLFGRTRWEDAALDERFRWRLDSLADPLWHLRTAVRASRGVDAFLSTNSYLTAWFTTRPDRARRLRSRAVRDRRARPEPRGADRARDDPSRAPPRRRAAVHLGGHSRAISSATSRSRPTAR